MGLHPSPDDLRKWAARGLIPADAAGPVEPPRGKAKRKPVATAAPPRWAVALTLPCRVVSEANQRGHWRAGERRGKAQARALGLALAFSGLGGWAGKVRLLLPCAVTWTHVGPRMDDDNLARAFKALRDELARLIGVNDGDPAVAWRYDQRAGPPGVEVRVEGGG
jgi:hypothetical protein